MDGHNQGICSQNWETFFQCLKKYKKTFPPALSSFAPVSIIDLLLIKNDNLLFCVFLLPLTNDELAD